MGCDVLRAGVICPPGGAVPAVRLHLLLLLTGAFLPWERRRLRPQPAALPCPAVAKHRGPAGGALPRLPVEAPGDAQALWGGAPPASLRLLPLPDLLLWRDGARPEEAGPD